MPGDDLIQVATAGMMAAAGRFEIRCGADITAFAMPIAVGAIRRHLRNTGWPVRLPEPHLRVLRAADELARRHDRAPTPSEIAAHLEIGRDEVLQGLEAGYAGPLASPARTVRSGHSEGLRPAR